LVSGLYVHAQPHAQAKLDSLYNEVLKRFIGRSDKWPKNRVYIRQDSVTERLLKRVGRTRVMHLTEEEMIGEVCWRSSKKGWLYGLQPVVGPDTIDVDILRWHIEVIASHWNKKEKSFYNVLVNMGGQCRGPDRQSPEYRWVYDREKHAWNLLTF
jgi:hypothetical protein